MCHDEDDMDDNGGDDHDYQCVYVCVDHVSGNHGISSFGDSAS